MAGSRIFYVPGQGCVAGAFVARDGEEGATALARGRDIAVHHGPSYHLLSPLVAPHTFERTVERNQLSPLPTYQPLQRLAFFLYSQPSEPSQPDRLYLILFPIHSYSSPPNPIHNRVADGA